MDFEEDYDKSCLKMLLQKFHPLSSSPFVHHLQATFIIILFDNPFIKITIARFITFSFTITVLILPNCCKNSYITTLPLYRMNFGYVTVNGVNSNEIRLKLFTSKFSFYIMGVLCDITVFTAIWQDKNCYSEGKRYETGYSNLFKWISKRIMIKVA